MEHFRFAISKSFGGSAVKKTGILTFHYSTNFGGVLQSYALYKVLAERGLDVEIIDYVPYYYQGEKLYRNLGFRSDFDVIKTVKRATKKIKYFQESIRKFNRFREEHIRSSRRLDEAGLNAQINDYGTIVVGSDQVWGPSKRKRPAYFLGYDNFIGKRVSYAADSTVSSVEDINRLNLETWLKAFEYISVRNEHTRQFVNDIIGKIPPVVADPTLLHDFNELTLEFRANREPYIFVYVLGCDLSGGNCKIIEKVKSVYGNLKVYAAVIPTMKFNIPYYVDKVIYDLGPIEWLNMIKNATFVLTDSFHGTLFSLKFHRPFIAYYVEEKRSTRFIDIAQRYKLHRHIVNSIESTDFKGSIRKSPDFDKTDKILRMQKATSCEFLDKALVYSDKSI